MAKDTLVCLRPWVPPRRAAAPWLSVQPPVHERTAAPAACPVGSVDMRPRTHPRPGVVDPRGPRLEERTSPACACEAWWQSWATALARPHDPPSHAASIGAGPRELSLHVIDTVQYRAATSNARVAHGLGRTPTLVAGGGGGRRELEPQLCGASFFLPLSGRLGVFAAGGHPPHATFGLSRCGAGYRSCTSRPTSVMTALDAPGLIGGSWIAQPCSLRRVPHYRVGAGAGNTSAHNAAWFPPLVRPGCCPTPPRESGLG